MSTAGYEWSDDLIPIIAWSGVAGIILVILAAIGLLLSQSAFFLILFFYIELQGIFTAWMAIGYYNSLLWFFVILVGSSIISGPSYNAYRRTKNIRKQFKEMTGQ